MRGVHPNNAKKLNDVSSEKIVLAGICQYGQDMFIDIQDVINPESFYDEQNRNIFLCINKCFKESSKLDSLVVLAEARSIGIGELIDVGYVKELFSEEVVQSNITVHAKRIAKLEIARKLQNTAKQIYNSLGEIDGTEPVSHILSLAEKPVLDFANTINNKEEQPVELGDNLLEYIEYLKRGQGKSIGISSGWSRYDNYIGGGFRRKTVSLVGARSGVGKSIFADNVAIHVAFRLKVPVLMLDTEMNIQDHHNRILGYFAKIPINSIEAGKFANNPIIEEKINVAAKKMMSMPYTYKNVAGKEFEEILAIVHRWLVKTVGFDQNGQLNDCLVIYDYLKLMQSKSISNSMQEFQVLGFQISDLHNFCVKYDFPVLAFVQLNRDGITKETTDVISQSDRLLWLATNFSIFKAKDEEEITADGEEFGNRKLIPVKARHGSGIEPGNYINMYMQGEYAMIEELRTKAEVIKSLDDDSFEVSDAPFE